ncbi:uncharacterized protein LY89DRAFT_763953 [Mollisia scopiformis]|uniref:Uncharacterized protein n=1 Tax=Mollisia scopiformis TaxID=149040 RepID=A0A132B8B9_MOLSC|nr:uncharacterized protein LY89DRAFT_763953 [Mollisia scopiformis]KUJ08645.1 hypothetical protein LY89DRAFT_763953 [Mollisia scopiformis]
MRPSKLIEALWKLFLAIQPAYGNALLARDTPPFHASASSPTPVSGSARVIPPLHIHYYNCPNHTVSTRELGGTSRLVSKNIEGVRCVPRTCREVPRLKDLHTYGTEVNDYLARWLDGVLKDPTQRAEMESSDSILEYFGQVHVYDGEFSCNLENGCKKGPDCDKILSHELDNPRGRTDEEIEREVKIVVLAALKMTTLNGIMKSTYAMGKNLGNLIFTMLSFSIGISQIPFAGDVLRYAQFIKQVIELEEEERAIQADKKLAKAPQDGVIPHLYATDACAVNKKVDNFKSSAALKKHIEDSFDNQSDMKQAMYGYLITTAWKAGRFYLKCQDDGYLDARSCDNKYPDTLRYCPENGITCQPEGYTMFTEGFNHEIPIIGADKLGHCGFDMDKIFETTYEQYLQHGNVAPKAFDFSNHSGSSFPVYISRHAVVWDHEHHNERKNGNFPCTCGRNWWSSETQSFLKGIGMDKSSRAYASALASDILINTCNKPLEKLPPVTEWIAKCRLGVRHQRSHDNSIYEPAWSDTYDWWDLETDPKCDMLLGAIADRKWNEKEANEQICHHKLPEADALLWQYFRGIQRETRLESRCIQFRESNYWAKYNWDEQVLTRDKLNQLQM